VALLTEADFKSTMGDPMRPVEEQTALPSDFWDYFDNIPAEDLGGYDRGTGDIKAAYRDPSARYDHVLLGSNDPDVFLAVVIHRARGQVYGHFLLDLPRVYGLR
jgi:hypothetical protein